MRSKVWRPAAAARNRSVREAREPTARHYDLRREELAARAAEAMPQTEARTRSPKTATVERREASVPRHGARRASQARQNKKCACRRSAHPSRMGASFTTWARTRRGNVMGCLTSEDG